MGDKRSILIVAFNALLFMMGLVVLAVSIAMSVMFQRDGWTAVISSQIIGLSVFAGVLLVLTSIGGCYSAKRKSRNLLRVNLFCIAILCIILMVAGSMLIRYAMVAQNQVDLQSIDLQAEDDKVMNNALISVYSKCCSGCNAVNVALYTNSLDPTCNMMSFVEQGDDFEQENNGWTAMRCNTTVQAQKFPGHPEILCENPGPCLATPENVDNCWIYPPNADRANENFPPQYIDKGFCSTLTTLQVNGRPLVGFPQDGGCGKGMVREFVNSMKEYFAPVLYSVGIVFVVFAVLLLANLIVGVYVLATARKKQEEDIPLHGNNAAQTI